MSGKTDQKRLLKVDEVAAMLGVHPKTVYRWIREGKIEVIKLPSGRIRIPESEIEKILRW